jgi:hypothetical protein
MTADNWDKKRTTGKRPKDNRETRKGLQGNSPKTTGKQEKDYRETANGQRRKQQTDNGENSKQTTKKTANG